MTHMQIWQSRMNRLIPIICSRQIEKNNAMNCIALFIEKKSTYANPPFKEYITKMTYGLLKVNACREVTLKFLLDIGH